MINNFSHFENNVVSMERIDQYSSNTTEVNTVHYLIRPGPEVMKLFHATKLTLLINVKMSTIVGI